MIQKWTWSSRDLPALHVISLRNPELAVDCRNLGEDPWFSSVCRSCGLAEAEEDVIAWASFLDEVVIDRCAGWNYDVRTVNGEQLTWLVRYLASRDLDFLLRFVI
jgi:hypothetical protein